LLAGCLLLIPSGWLLVWLSADVPELRSMLKSVPLLGPIARWAALARFSRLLALLIENRLTMPECLRLAGAGSRDAELLGACRLAADSTEGGQSLRASLGALAAFPKSLGPIAEWGEQARALPEALRTAAEMFEGRVETQLTLLRMLTPPLTFLLVLWGLLFLVSGALLPMVGLIEKLT
jgi:type II secretory pathway component PulF